MKRLLGVADNTLVVHAIRLALRQTAGFQVVGFVDGRQPVVAHRCTICEPDIVLVDDMQHPENASRGSARSRRRHRAHSPSC